MAWKGTVPAGALHDLLAELVNALDFHGDPILQIARTNLVVGVLKDHLEDRRPRPAADQAEETIRALREVAQGADDAIALAAAKVMWDMLGQGGPR